LAQASQEPGRGGPSAPVVIGLLAAFLLGALSAAAFLTARRRPPARVVPAGGAPAALLASSPPPAVVPARPAPAAPRPPATKEADEDAGPLTVSLAATNAGRHVKVGAGVTFTAFTAQAPGRSATLTIYYRRDRGRKIVFSFAQGTLCSTTWMAPAPGRYEFTASALGDRRRDAVSRDVEITVDAPPAPRVAAAPPAPKVAPIAEPVAKRPVAAESAAVRPPVYHVAAAHFARARSAEALAGALRQSGYRAAAVRRMNDAQGKSVYVVETGTFRRPAEVYAAVAVLLRSGYPAYFYAGR